MGLRVEEINTQRTAYIFLQYKTEVRRYHRIRWSQDCIIYLPQQSRLSTKFLPIEVLISHQTARSSTAQLKVRRLTGRK